MARYTPAHVVEAKKTLHDLLRPGEVVYAIQRDTTASGTSVIVSLVIIRDNRPVDISLHTAILLEMTMFDRQGKRGVRVIGVRDNSAKWLVEQLSKSLFEQEAPKPSKANQFSAHIRDRPADMWLMSEWL